MEQSSSLYCRDISSKLILLTRPSNANVQIVLRVPLVLNPKGLVEAVILGIHDITSAG